MIAPQAMNRCYSVFSPKRRQAQRKSRKRISLFESGHCLAVKRRFIIFKKMATDAFSEICLDLAGLQQSNQLCDGVLRSSDGEEFGVHRCILFVASAYFRDIYLAALSSGLATDLTLADTHASVLSLVLEYIYTRKASVTMSNVASMIPAAARFQLPGIVDICTDFLINNMNIENCIRIFNLATNYNCRKLEQASRRFIMINFVQISKTSLEYGSLTPENLESFLRSDELNLMKEEQGFESLMRWVEHEPEKRRPYLPTLLCCLRFGLCDNGYFRNMISHHPYIKDTRECQSALVAASHILAEVEGNRHSILDLTHPLLRPRIPNQILFVIGGWSAGAATNLVETYDIRSNRWFIAAVGDIMPRAYHGLATVNSKIYMIGGFDGNQYFNSVRCFDPVSHLWSERGCMHEARCYVSTAVLHGLIYALGGYDGHRRTNTGEIYDPKTNQWTMISPMNNRRSDASAAALIDKVYIAGGFDGQVVLDSSEMYDPVQNVWAEIHHMLSPRSGTKLVAYNGSVYVLGGWNGMIRLRTGECYDTLHDRWQDIPEMNTPRSNFAVDVVENSLMVVGGFNGTTTVPLVESYNHATNSWSTLCNMNLNRSAVSATVLRELSNAAEYSFLGN